MGAAGGDEAERAAAGGGDHWGAGGHRLQVDEAEGLVYGGRGEEVGAVQAVDEVPVGAPSGEEDVVVDAEVAGQGVGVDSLPFSGVASQDQ